MRVGSGSSALKSAKRRAKDGRTNVMRMKTTMTARPRTSVG